MKPIFLIGYPGCGKTTLGRALADHLKINFYDLDHYITSRFRTTIPEMFATVGEEEFRRRESVMLREIGEMENVIIACGGGTPCFHDNMEYMDKNGTTVWLKASEPVLIERILRAGKRRPMFADCLTDDAVRQHLKTLGEQREKIYARAHYSFNADELESRAMIDNSVKLFIRQILTQKTQ